MHQTFTPIAILALSAPIAAADVIAEDPAILAPFEFTEVSVEFMGSSAGYTGELNWIDPDLPNVSTTLFNNHQSIVGDSYTIPRLFTQGERVDFTYNIIAGADDRFSTSNPDDWNQFRIDDTDPTALIVAVEDLRPTSTDADYNDVIFRVRFFQSVIPAPGALGFFAMTSIALVRRYRR